MNPFDLYRNVKEFTIESCFFQTNTADDEGGSWVRNYDLSNATESVYITNSSFETTQEDEPFAIFIPQDTNSVVKDVFVTGCSFKISGANRAIGLSAHIESGASNSTLENIIFDNCSVYIDANITSYAWKHSNEGSGTVRNLCIDN